MSRVPLTEGFFRPTAPATFARGKTVYVYNYGTETQASLYTAYAGGSSVTQPLKTNSGGTPRGPNGETVWAAAGNYTVKVGNESFPWFPSAGSSISPLWVPGMTSNFLDDHQEFIAAEPGRAAIVADPLGEKGQVIRVDNNNADGYPKTPTENPRAQLLSPPLFADRTTSFIHVQFMLPVGTPAIIGGKFFQLCQVYGPPAAAGGAPWQLTLTTSGGKEIFVWQRNETYGYDVPVELKGFPLKRGYWHDLYLKIYMQEYTGSSNGYVQMWFEGQPVTFFKSGESYNPGSYTETQKLIFKTRDAGNNGGNNLFYFGNYRKINTEGMTGTVSTYFVPPKIGLTKASVE